MEELNEKQETVQNEELQPVVEQTANGNDSNSNVTPEPVSEPAAETPATTPETPATPQAETAPAVENTSANEENIPTDEENAPEDDNAPAEDEQEPEVDYTQMSRDELLAAITELMQQDVAKIRNRVRAIRDQFNSLNRDLEQQALKAFEEQGGNKEDFKFENDLTAQEFYKTCDAYRARRQKMQEEMEAQKQQNLVAKRQILDELRALIDKDEDTLKQTYDEFNAIQEKWKGIGDVPREEMNDLWQNYHFLIEQFFNKVKINKELRLLDLKRNLEQKIQLCERAEELIVETSVVKAFKSLQDLRTQWKEIGPVPSEQSEEIWQRFNNAANQIDERRREYYDQRKEELDQNLLAKQALIAKAEEVTKETPQSTKEWNDTTEALDELLKLWKSIGPVPRENNEEVWDKFKGIIDKHYADKKQHFGQMRDEQNENYNKKVDLCLRAEAIAKREDWKNATADLLQLQAEWKTIGPTSRKVSDKIWHRFRGACDEFFAKKGEYFKEIRSNESENLTKKSAIIDELKAFDFGEDKEENLNAIKDFQRRWAEIGHVPMKEKDRIMKEFRGLLDGVFEKLKISAREADDSMFRSRIRPMSVGMKRSTGNENQDILNRIEKLKADLKLWENNIGFLANSKQADLLKEEMERKMEATRQEIAILSAKLKDKTPDQDTEANETAE